MRFRNVLAAQCHGRTFLLPWLWLLLLTNPGLRASPADPALDPVALNRAPGPEYGPAQRRFQGIPGIARAPGGRLWATWYSGGTNEGSENYVLLATSDDDGKSWSDARFVIDPPSPIRAFDAAVWVDPRGRLWWFYAQSYNQWDGRAGVWAVTTDEPDRPNPRWSPPRRLCDGIMMNKPIVLKQGDWLLPVAAWNRVPTQKTGPTQVPAEYLHWDPSRAGIHVYRSTDQGATFELLGTAKGPEFRSEHMIVERRDGSLWMLVRTNPSMAESVSTDGGRSWSEGKPATIPHVPSRFFIRRLNSGRLLLVKHNPRLDTIWLTGIRTTTATQQRSHLTAYLSNDDGQTWRGGLLLDERLLSSYPDGDQAPDGTIYIISDFARLKEKEILLARFNEEDVLAGRLVSPGSRTRFLVNKGLGLNSEAH
ncbi:MAG: exo-alpha-sialidase [Opitutaceae bacterium]|nr:exo-alpha-sialidase [Opitutaceae bacterium]